MTKLPVKTIFVFVFSLLAWTVCQAEEDKAAKKENLLVENQSIIGYWMAEENALFEQLKAQSQKQLEDGTVTEEQIREQAKKYSTMMVMHYHENGETNMHTTQGKHPGKFEVVAKRPEKSEIDVDVTSEKFGLEKGTVTFKKDTIVLSSREHRDAKVTLKRTSAEKAQELIKAIPKKPPVPGE